MALSPGTRLGPYEIVGLLGTGGMGEVYRARDLRLDRHVALKVLATALADNAEFRARFNQEARAISQLTHPHICTLHDVGEQDGMAFLVMELLDGETLAHRLTRGALPPALALRVALQIADALSVAHRHGIVHRDLKPGNVMLTKSGAKLVDFGLAKGTSSVIAGWDRSEAQTAPPNLTAQGTILGTFEYMAPEQLEGLDADARTDIFAFGAVLYEMFAGRRAFEGNTQASRTASIMSATPRSLMSAQPRTPPLLDRLVMTCLAKQPDERWQSIQDLRRELGWVNDHFDDPATAAGVTGAGRRTVLGVAGVLLIAAGMVGAVAIGRWRAPTGGHQTVPVSRFSIMLPTNETLSVSDNASAGAALALSRDGSHLAYVTERAGRVQLTIRALDQLEPRLMEGTEGAVGPFFSPDGEWVGFFADGKLKRVSVRGGAPITVAVVPPVSRGATWSPDGTIFLTPTYADPLYRVPAAGGTITPVTSLGEGESNHLLPEMVSGGKAFMFTAWQGGRFDEASIWLWSPATGRRKLIDAGSAARYAASGHLIFARGTSLLAATLDGARLAVTGPPTPVADDIRINPANGTAEFALSDTGTLAYLPTPVTPERSYLTWIDRGGREDRLGDMPGLMEKPRLSPDGRRCVVEHLNDLWVYEFASGRFTRVTFQGVNQSPVWSADGKRLTFNRAAPGKPPTVFSTPADGSGQPEALTSGPAVDFPNDWSPDGQVLAFARVAGVGQENNWDIIGLSDDGKTSPIVNGPFKEFGPVFSPDGRWLAYVSDQSGRREVYVRPYPSAGALIQVSSNGGDQPRWGRDGAELFFYQGAQFMHVRVSTTPEFSASRPVVMFSSLVSQKDEEPSFPRYDVSPDGRRFLMVTTNTSDTRATRLNIVLNWFEELRRRVPK